MPLLLSLLAMIFLSGGHSHDQHELISSLVFSDVEAIPGPYDVTLCGFESCSATSCAVNGKSCVFADCSPVVTTFKTQTCIRGTGTSGYGNDSKPFVAYGAAYSTTAEKFLLVTYNSTECGGKDHIVSVFNPADYSWCNPVPSMILGQDILGYMLISKNDCDCTGGNSRTPKPSTSANGGGGDGGKSNKGVIIGSIVGGIIFVAALSGLAFWYFTVKNRATRGTDSFALLRG